MAEHRDVTSNRFEFYTYRVGRSQLDRLFSIAAEGFAPSDLKFETERSGTRLTRSTLEELVSAVAASSLPGDPNIWENLTFSTYSSGRQIAIEINPHSFRAYLSGPDATWVHGQTARLKAIIEPMAGDVRPGELHLRRAGKIGILTGILTSLTMAIIAQAVGENIGTAITGSITIGGFLGLVVFFIGSSGKGKNQTLLSATGEITESKWWRDLSASERIALGALTMTALAAVAASISAYSDVWGS